MGPGVIPS